MDNGTDDLEAQLVEEIADFTHDPLGYVLYAFPWGERGTELEHETGPREWQRETLESIGAKLQNGATRHEAILEATSSGHGIGKSALVAWLVRWALDTFEDAKVVVTANTERQLSTKTWPEVAKWHRLSITAHWFTFTATSLYSTDTAHEKTWRADAIGWSEHNTEAFAGLHNQGKRILLIFDEASAISDKAWEVPEGALTDANTEILWLPFGNPTRATGRFRECFRRFKHRWTTRQIDSRTVEGTNKAQLEKWVEDYGENSDFVKMRVRGIFPSASPKQFISETDVDAAYGKHLPADRYSFAPKIITVDSSWEGGDELVIGLRQGFMFRILKAYPQNDNDIQIAQDVAFFEDDLNADAVFVDGGFGTGIISVGRTWKRNWQVVWFGGESSDPSCYNKRAQMWKMTRTWLKEGGALPLDPTLREELMAPEIAPRLDGKLQIESKKDMKARGIPSPNRADALVMSFAFPVLSKELQNSRPTTHTQAETDYDPMERMLA